MICVAANNRDSLAHIPQWQNEIAMTEPQKPVMLVLTKSDLVDYVDEPVTYEEIKQAKEA